MSPAGRLAAALDAAFPDGPPAHLGVAVSGGGDSMALLHLLDEWAGPTMLHVVTVDHGLRPGAAEEAAQVAAAATALGIPHDILRWEGWGGTGNLQDAARAARYRLMSEWARGKGLAAVALGHTQEDQAETVLMRLARGSGVDGLSAMQAERRAYGMRWLRPLLRVARGELRDALDARGVTWSEDPSNQDPRFDRVRVRAAMEALGLDARRLAETATRMADARQVLEEVAHSLGADALTWRGGIASLDTAALSDALPETRHRLVADVLRKIAAVPYAPRRDALEASLADALAGETRTLGGCLLIGGATLVIAREPAAVGDPVALGTRWDGRWDVSGPETGGLRVAALGDAGLTATPDWRETGLPRRALLAEPGVWQGETLVAAPTLTRNTPYEAHFRPDCDEFSL